MLSLDWEALEGLGFARATDINAVRTPPLAIEEEAQDGDARDTEVALMMSAHDTALRAGEATERLAALAEHLFDAMAKLKAPDQRAERAMPAVRVTVRRDARGRIESFDMAPIDGP